MRTPTVATRAARKLVALLTVVSLLTPFTIARGAEGCGTSSGPWTVLAGPRFPAGTQTISDLAVDARSPSLFFVTNGVSVMRSTDGGCSWTESYTLGEQISPDQTFTPANARIESVVVPEAGGRALLSIAETVVNQERPHVLVSTDAGRSWQSGDSGLPPLGSPQELVVAPSSPDIAYLGLDLGGGTLDSIFASADGGLTWEARQQHVGGEFDGFEVDPLVPTEIWAYGEGFHRSTDGGQTFVPIEEFVGVATGPAAVFHKRGKPSSVMVFLPDSRSVQRSIDGGATWLEGYGLVGATSITFGFIPDSVLVTAAGDVYSWVPQLYSWYALKPPVGGLTDAQGSRAGSESFFFHNARQVVVYAGPTAGDIKPTSPEFVIGNISLLDPPEFLDPEPPKLTPKGETIKIPLGKEKRVTYDLSLSKVRTPLDLYFLVDTSDSAKRFLKGLASVLEDVVNRLYDARLDVEFGLAEYRAYPDSTPPRPACDGPDVPVVQDPQCERNFVYHQVLDVSPTSHQFLARAIEELDPAAGGYYNAPLPALYQTATGAGQDLFPPGPLGHDVPAGNEASFRGKALKVVLNATDEEFIEQPPYGNDDNPPDIPELGEVTAALNARGIDQIGLALGPGAVTDLNRVAAATDAVAPVEGADCDGNGSADLAAGAPLVCAVNRSTLEEGSNLVPAIVNMVEAVRDRSPVSLQVDAKRDVIADVTPGEYPGVVLQSDQALKFDVTYTCPTSMAGEKTEIDLVAAQGSRELATATSTVVCGKKDKKPFFTSSPFEAIIGILPLLPLAPPPTLANPSSATQAQSQAQAQSAMATQEQEQPQLAYVAQYKSALKEALAKEEELAMSSYRDRTSPQPPPGLLLAGASALMAAAYGVAVSRGRRRRYAFSRRR